MTPQLVVLAGPDRAGKSTFDDVFLAGSPLPFLNADLFAAETGISPAGGVRGRAGAIPALAAAPA